MNTAIEAEGPSRHIQSTRTNAYTMNEPGERQVQTRADLEPEVQPEAPIDPSAPVDPDAPAADAVDPVAAATEQTLAQDDQNVAQADAHKVAGPEGVAQIESLRERVTELQTQEAALSAGFDERLEALVREVDEGGRSQADAMREQIAIEKERNQAIRQVSSEMAEYMSEIKSIERDNLREVATFRGDYLADPEVSALMQDPEVQRMIHQPTAKEKALGLDHPPTAVAHAQAKRYKEQAEGYKAQLDAQSLTVAAAAENENLNKINAGAGTLPSKVPTTNKPPNARTDPQGYQAHLASYFSTSA